jgi:hypothetical protein
MSLIAIVVLVHHHEFLPTSQKISRDFETTAAVQLCGAIGAGGVVSAEFRIRFGWLYDTIAPIFFTGMPSSAVHLHIYP